MLTALPKLLVLISFSLISSIASAHMIWLERASNGYTLAYFGEPQEAKKEAADKLTILKKVTVQQADTSFKGIIQDNHLLFKTRPDQDVYLATQLVHKGMLVLFRAKNNSHKQKATLDYEFVKIKGKTNTFQLLFNNKPVINSKVMLVYPDLTNATLTTQKNGEFTIIVNNKGQYILQAIQSVDKTGQFNGNAYKKAVYVTTLTFTRS